jgi:hypothetical protein
LALVSTQSKQPSGPAPAPPSASVGGPEDADGYALPFVTAAGVSHPEDVVLENWFIKKGNTRMGRSHKRWCALNSNEVRYYVTQSMEVLKGSIAVRGDTSSYSCGCMLHIRNPDRTWELSAADTATCEKWRKTIVAIAAAKRKAAAAVYPEISV